MENKEIGEGMLKVSNIAVSLDEKDYAKVIANTLNIRKIKSQITIMNSPWVLKVIINLFSELTMMVWSIVL